MGGGGGEGYVHIPNELFETTSKIQTPSASAMHLGTATAKVITTVMYSSLLSIGCSLRTHTHPGGDAAIVQRPQDEPVSHSGQ